ncbi:basic proline-rich protein-like [Anomalospiza imberbis]|uniref:basic proline-rich protein-like n=1 Tax=Anomalospiza imberbis TaxID=187417 RepID=UPI00358E80B6
MGPLTGRRKALSRGADPPRIAAPRPAAFPPQARRPRDPLPAPSGPRGPRGPRPRRPPAAPGPRCPAAPPPTGRATPPGPGLGPAARSPSPAPSRAGRAGAAEAVQARLLGPTRGLTCGGGGGRARAAGGDRSAAHNEPLQRHGPAPAPPADTHWLPRARAPGAIGFSARPSSAPPGAEPPARRGEGSGAASRSEQRPGRAGPAAQTEPCPRGFRKGPPAPAAQTEPCPRGFRKGRCAPAAQTEPCPRGFRKGPPAPAAQTEPRPRGFRKGRCAPAAQTEPCPRGFRKGRCAPAAQTEPRPRGFRKGRCAPAAQTEPCPRGFRKGRCAPAAAPAALVERSPEENARPVAARALAAGETRVVPCGRQPGSGGRWSTAALGPPAAGSAPGSRASPRLKASVSRSPGTGNLPGHSPRECW